MPRATRAYHAARAIAATVIFWMEAIDLYRHVAHTVMMNMATLIIDAAILMPYP